MLIVPYLKQAFFRWYDGKYEQHVNDPESPAIFVGGWQKRHWSANAARLIVSFFLAHWQWITNTVLAIAALIAAVLALK